VAIGDRRVVVPGKNGDCLLAFGPWFGDLADGSRKLVCCISPAVQKAKYQCDRWVD
jgi:hypothetical protein